MNFNHDTGLIDTLLTIDTTIAPPLGGSNSLTILGTGSLYLPTGTNLQRPANSTGMLRYNTDVGGLEYNTGAAWSTVLAAGSAVTSITATASNVGLSVSGGTTQTITSTGTFALTLDAGLESLAALSSTGVIVQSTANTFVARTITGTASNISVTNGSGVAGDPTIDLINAGTPITNALVKITTDAKGRVTSSSAVVAGDITTLVDSTYVNVAGDTMSSAANLTFSGGGEVLGLPATPTTAGSAASKAYVDALVQGLDPKQSVRVASTVPGTLATSFENGDTIDGIVLVTGNRILLKNQADPAENGLFIVNASGAPTRAPDMDNWLEVPGAFVFVEESGSTQADTGWVCTSNSGGTLGTTAITWVQFSGAGTYTAGTGLTLTGTQFSLTVPVAISSGGTGLTSTPLNGQIDIGNGTTFVRTTLTQGTGITVTNGAGSITIANAGVTTVAGTANQVTASASTGAVTLSIPSTFVAPGSIRATTSITADGLTANSFLFSGTAGLLTTTAAPTNGQLLIGSTGAAPVAAALTQGTGITVTNGAGSITIANAGVTTIAGTANQVTASASTGAVTLSLPSAVTLPGSLVVTTSATVSGLTANSFLFSGTAGLLTTTAAPTNGQLLIGSTGVAPVATTLTQGTGITVTNGAGSITIANAGVTTFSAGTTGLTPSTATSGAITLGGTLNIANGGTGAATTSQNFVFVGPTSGTGAPSFRTLTLGDLTTNALRLYIENPSTPTAPTATGANAVAIGSGASAGGSGAFSVGNGTSTTLFGANAAANGTFATAGDAQRLNLISRGITTTAAITEIFLDGAGASQRMILPNNSLWTFSILIAGRRTDATGGGAGYRVDGVIRRDGSAATTTLTGAVAKSVLGETNAAWDVTVDADTTNGSLRIRVTGEAAKTIRWVATAQIAQVTN